MAYPQEDDIVPIEEFEPEPWSQHPDETDKNYRAFQAFRDLGRERSVRKAYMVAYDKPNYEKESAPSHMYDWKKRYSWDERVEKWDEHQDQKRQEKYEEEMEEYYEDVIDYAQNSSTHLLEALDARFKGKDPQEKADLVFGEDSMDLEGFARCFTQLNNIADNAFGTFTKDEEDKESGGILESIEEAVNE